MTPSAPGCLPRSGGPECRLPALPSPSGSATASADGGTPAKPEGPLGVSADLLLWVGLGLVVAVLAAVAALMLRSGTRSDAAVGTAFAQGPVPVGTDGADAPWAQGPAGVTQGSVSVPVEASALITAHDLAVTDEDRAELARRLAEHGILAAPVRPGDPLDPRLHNVVGRWPVGESETPRTVANVERPGWLLTREGDVQMLRPADVCVWV